MYMQTSTYQQVNHYYPYGGLMGESTGGDIQKYKYNGKRLERNHGLDWYDYGARHYDAAIGSWPTMDPLAEKYYSVSPYAYCGGNPVNAYDPTGADWYKDTDNTYQYSPTVHSQDDLKNGQTYLWKSMNFKRQGINYRSDGSILYNNETSAYNRMWNQADQHYRKLDSGGREVGGFILKDGRVLVLPDYANDNETTKIDYYGYHIQKNGIVKRGDEKFNVIGQVHTHQNKSLSAEPSTYLGDSYGDLGLSVYNSSLPVFTIGHDKKIHGIRGYLGTDNVPVGLIVTMNSRDSSRQNLLNGRTSLFSIIQRLPKL